jgi:hypothetical protein
MFFALVTMVNKTKAAPYLPLIRQKINLEEISDENRQIIFSRKSLTLGTELKTISKNAVPNYLKKQ